MMRILCALLIVVELVACARAQGNSFRVSSLPAKVQCGVTFVPLGDRTAYALYRVRVYNGGSKEITATRVRVRPWKLPKVASQSDSSVTAVDRTWLLVDSKVGIRPLGQTVVTERTSALPVSSGMSDRTLPCLISAVRFSDGTFWSITPETVVPSDRNASPGA